MVSHILLAIAASIPAANTMVFAKIIPPFLSYFIRIWLRDPLIHQTQRHILVVRHFAKAESGSRACPEVHTCDSHNCAFLSPPGQVLFDKSSLREHFLFALFLNVYCRQLLLFFSMLLVITIFKSFAYLQLSFFQYYSP